MGVLNHTDVLKPVSSSDFPWHQAGLALCEVELTACTCPNCKAIEQFFLERGETPEKLGSRLLRIPYHDFSLKYEQERNSLCDIKRIQWPHYNRRRLGGYTISPST